MEELGLNERQVRAAKNQSLFREVNEKLEGLAQAFALFAETSSFACECADTKCVARIELSLSQYEQIRSASNRFAVLPGHVYPDVERIVAEHETFCVVEKIGAGAAVAEAADPRR